MTNEIMEMGQQNAVVRDNALILYFDKAETPFVARYDLDSLAQANFEVSTEAAGSYVLALRDYAGRSQSVGSFANKADAHQALYTILQALLQGQTKGDADGKACAKRGVMCRAGCCVLRFLKWLCLLIGALVVLYIVLGFIPVPNAMRTMTSEKNAAPSVVAPVTRNAPANTVPDTVPEGVAVDADTLFGHAPAQPEQPAEPEETEETTKENNAQDTDASLSDMAE